MSIDDGAYSGFSPVADAGDLSPYSSTSVNWDSKWPIKPEILLDGGNVPTNGADFTNCPDLSLLTTNHQPLLRHFSSSATAQAAWMATQLLAEYPGIWPETVRALLVHSSRWTDAMQRRFKTNELKTQGRRNLLRSCGYGIPNLDRAIRCMNNSVNMIIQKGWKDRYRYPSCGLRFDVINSDESIEEFKKRINIKMRGEDRKDKGDGSSGSGFLGSDKRDVGSIHSDFIKDSAINLCNTNTIAVYPVIGWWRERSYLGKCDSKIRYSLIISLSTPKRDADFYTSIVSKIPNVVQTDIPTA